MKKENFNENIVGAFRRNVGYLSGVALILGSVFAVNVAWIFLYRNRHGMIAEYYSDTNLSQLYDVKRVDEINFDFGPRPPLDKFRSKTFSIRFSGSLYIENPGDYKIVVISDDGVRLWIDGNLVIDNWTDRNAAQDVFSAFFSPGLHKLKLEYYQARADAQIRLLWKAPGKDLTVIPMAHLMKE